MGSSKFYFDPLVKTLCTRSGKLSHRSLFVLRGEDVTNQAVGLYHLISKAAGSGAGPSSVLWCHKKDANLPKSSRKSMKALESKIKSGKVELTELSPLDLLLHSAAVRFCNYNDTHTVLGNTYTICILQDFECITPNILCRVVETVRGGGSVLLLLPDVSHLRELKHMDMNVHYKLTTRSHPTAQKLFNNRFLLSLAWCKSCIILNSEMRLCHEDVSNMKYKGIEAVSSSETEQQNTADEDLQQILDAVADADKPLPQLIQLCKTHDQAVVLSKLVDVITEQREGEVVSVTAKRGRGKSAALGLAVAAAIDLGVNNIFVTSPTPQNLTSFFQLLLAGFDALEYEEGRDYEILQSTNPSFNGAVVRVNVMRNRKHTVQYVLPSDHSLIHEAQLVVIDEAAAIPLLQVQAMLGKHITLMASTVAGYEGTGRSLSHKLLNKLRKASVAAQHNTHKTDAVVPQLHEVSLDRSIRYSCNDPVESWLYKLLCLSATEAVTPSTTCPPPQHCQLYNVDKRVLLSGNKGSEQFLLQVQSLLVSSHYRNSPDDLQVLADAPAHHLFVLLPPLPSDNIATLPPVLCVLQVCMEGNISPSVSSQVLRRGERPPGDLVPWTLAAQFQDPAITQYTGARIIRAATHPDYQGMGYGSSAIKQLQDYYGGRLVNLSDIEPTQQQEQQEHGEDEQHTGPIGVSASNTPLLCRLSERLPEHVDYLSVSYGITPQLHKFWAKAKFIPLYVCQVVNKTTGEHSCSMVHPVSQDGEELASLPEWLQQHSSEFVRRLLELLGGSLKRLHPMLAYDLIRAHYPHTKSNKSVTWREVECTITGHDLRRLEKYSTNVADRHLITDLIPHIANLFCQQRLPDLSLSHIQSALVIGSGLQNTELIDVGNKLGLNAQSTLGNFNRAMRRVYTALADLQESVFASKLATVVPDLLQPVNITADQDHAKLAKEMEAENPDLHFHKKRREGPEKYGRNTKKHKPGKYRDPR